MNSVLKRIDIEQIAKKYGYTLPLKKRKTKPPINLMKLLPTFHSWFAGTIQGLKEREIDAPSILFAQKALCYKGNNVCLSGYWCRNENLDYMLMYLTSKDSLCAPLGRIKIQRISDSKWNISDLFVSPQFQSCGIGGQLIQMATILIMNAYEDIKKFTFIKKVAQLTLLEWGLKQGFSVHPDDIEKIKQLQAHNTSLIIVDAPNDEHSFIEWYGERKSYIVEKEKFDPNTFWNIPEKDELPLYVTDSFRIRLIKMAKLEIMQ